MIRRVVEHTSSPQTARTCSLGWASLGQNSSPRTARTCSRAGGALVCLLALASCGKKSSTGPAPEITGLAAVPISAQVVITADVARVIDAPLVDRAIDQLLLHDSNLAARWQQLHDTCKLEAAQFKHVTVALGTPTGPNPGTGPTLIVATGKIAESEFSACVRGMVGSGGGTLTGKDINGHTLYQAKDGNRTMFFTFGRADTVLLSADEPFLTEALGTGKKVLDNPDMAGWAKLANEQAPLWAFGQVDQRVRANLVRVTGGQLSSGPLAVVASVDPSKGLSLSLGAVMANAADAKTLETFAKANLGMIGMASQAKSLGKIVDKVQIAADGPLVRFTANLDADEVNQLISALDAGGAAPQDSPPAPGSGSGSQ